MLIASLPYQADPTVYFERIHALKWPALLDSNHQLGGMGHYDIQAADPSCMVKIHNQQCYVDTGAGFEARTEAPLDIIQQALSHYPIDAAQVDTDLPFYGGALGFFGYDYGRELEHIPNIAINDIPMPDLWVGIYMWAIVTDHIQQVSWFVSHLDSEANQTLLALIKQKTESLYTPFALQDRFTSNMNYADYADKFAKINAYIHAGDCYQVCLAQRFSASYEGHPWLAYKALRQTSPNPFSGYIETDQGALLSLSPERFLQVQGLQVETCPIKGTRPRGKTPTEDQQLYQQLQNSTKDQAENLMIVDLLRNDLSKQCIPGSVQVKDIFAIESYRNVHHMVTRIGGKLDNHQRLLPLLQGAFPGGSITGAPKIRAMEIIEELEPHRRNAYTGSLGYISFHGAMDTNILIRSMLVCPNQNTSNQNTSNHSRYLNLNPSTQTETPKTHALSTQSGQIYCWGGGGLVADSECQAEYEETLVKVNHLLARLNPTS